MEENAVGTKKIIFYEVKRVCTKIRDSNATHIHLAQVAWEDSRWEISWVGFHSPSTCRTEFCIFHAGLVHAAPDIHNTITK